MAGFTREVAQYIHDMDSLLPGFPEKASAHLYSAIVATLNNQEQFELVRAHMLKMAQERPASLANMVYYLLNNSHMQWEVQAQIRSLYTEALPLMLVSGNPRTGKALSRYHHIRGNLESRYHQDPDHDTGSPGFVVDFKTAKGETAQIYHSGLYTTWHKGSITSGAAIKVGNKVTFYTQEFRGTAEELVKRSARTYLELTKGKAADFVKEWKKLTAFDEEKILALINKYQGSQDKLSGFMQRVRLVHNAQEAFRDPSAHRVSPSFASAYNLG